MSPPIHLAKTMATYNVKHDGDHPLCPLTSREIRSSAEAVKSTHPGRPEIQFKSITLQEPPKAILGPYLDAEHQGRRAPKIDRKAFVSYYVRNTNRLHETVVNLSSHKVESNIRVGPDHHAPVDTAEIVAVEQSVFEDENIRSELAKLQLPKGTAFVCDPWIYSSDNSNERRRLLQAFLYMRDPANPNNADSNHYAFPLPIVPVLDPLTMKVIRIDTIATGKGPQKKPISKAKFHPPKEYTPEHQQLRQDLKPLHVVQPEGTSFTATPMGELGQIIEWQKWFFRVGFNQREGMVLYDVRYDKRSLFYRLSLSDMNIPYADPRSPLHRKAAFDLGDVGAGVMANDLKLGCDCLGSIFYMGGVISDDRGEPDNRPNAICIHEQDAGILWKHTNYRTGRAVVVRNRELVVQSIITVANYEYVLAFIFNQAGEVTYDVRASGIVSTQPIDEGISVPWGTVIHPGVLASHHQHLFSLRIDPAINGNTNTLVKSEAHAMPINEFNPEGTGYTVQETTIPRSTGLNLDSDSNRVFKITNPSFVNPITHQPVSYKITAPPFQKMLAHPSSYNHRRAEFADRNIYVTRYRDGELYAGGQYTNQSKGGHGVRAWANRDESIVGQDGKGDDIVVWVQFGLQHIVRTEDWPVMPAESIRVSLKPCNFFDANPALDCAPSEQVKNKSVLVNGNSGSSPYHMAEKHLQGGKIGKVNGVVQNGCGCDH